MRPEGTRLLQVNYVLGDLAATVLAFLLSYWARDTLLGSSLGKIYPIQSYGWMLLVAMVSVPIIFSLLKLYEFDTLEGQTSLLRKTQRLLRGMALEYVLFSVLVFSLKLHYVSRLFLFLFIVSNFVLLVVLRAGLWPLLSRRVKKEPLRVLIVGSGEKALDFASLLSKKLRVGTRLVGLLVEKTPVRQSLRDIPILGGVDEAESVLSGHAGQAGLGIDEVLMIPEDNLNGVQPILSICQRLGITARLACDFLPLGTAKLYLEQLEGVPLLTFATTPRNADRLAFKRITDVIYSLAIMFFCLPLFIVVPILIKLTSKGPILYRQMRCGLDGRPFTFLKFRSMVEGADEMRKEIAHLNEAEGPIFKISDDPRVTKVGRLLRRTSIDELPQLFNVLRGEMSLVGPRPPLPSEVERYDGWQRRRLSMKPGLTCLWQISGRSILGFEKWVELDLRYIDNWSPWLDFKIMLKTVPAVASWKGAW